MSFEPYTKTSNIISSWLSELKYMSFEPYTKTTKKGQKWKK